MKMSKILATLVAGTIAASTMMVAASAEEKAIDKKITVTNASTVAVFTGEINTSGLIIDKGSKASIIGLGLAELGLNTGIFRVDGYNKDLKWVIDSGASLATNDDWSGWDRLSKNDIGLTGTFGSSVAKIKVIIKAYLVDTNGVPDYDATSDFMDDLNTGAFGWYFGKWVAEAVTLNGVHLMDVTTDGILGLSTVGAPITDGIWMAMSKGSIETFTDKNSQAATYNLEKFAFTVAEKAQLKTAKSATFTANLADVSRTGGYATVKVDDHKNITATILEGKQTSIEVKVPTEYLYLADYDEFFSKIVLNVTNGKILDATLSFVYDDGAAVVAPVEDVEDAEDDTDAAIEDEDFVEGDEDTIDNITDEDEIDDGSEDADVATDTVVAADEAGKAGNPDTGVAVAIIPAAIAAIAVVVARKRK